MRDMVRRVSQGVIAGGVFAAWVALAFGAYLFALDRPFTGEGAQWRIVADQGQTVVIRWTFYQNRRCGAGIKRKMSDALGQSVAVDVIPGKHVSRSGPWTTVDVPVRIPDGFSRPVKVTAEGPVRCNALQEIWPYWTRFPVAVID